MAAGRRRPREVRREVLPTLFRRRRWYAADFRQWGHGRITLRDPDALGWPDAGERTEDPEVALDWVVRGYLPLFRDGTRRRQLRLGPAPRALGEAATAYVDWLRSHGHPRTTCDGYASALMHLRIEFGDACRTDRLTTPVLQQLFDAMATESYAPNTLLAVRQGISSFLDWLIHGEPTGEPGRRQRRTRDNPALHVRMPIIVQQEVVPWTPDELEALRDAADRCDQEHDDFRAHRLAVELALASGGRRNELFAVRWEQIDAEAYTIRFTRQLDKGVRRLVPLKGKRARRALLLPSWWAHHRRGATGYVLAARDGALVHPDRVFRLRRRILDAAQLYRAGRGYHIDRHTYASAFIAEGGRFEELQKSLGHASIVVTEQTYGHFHEDVAAALARRRIYREEPIRIVG